MSGTKTIQLFVRVDEHGEIISSQLGENIIATEEFDFFFLVSDIEFDFSEYKVVIEGFKPLLVKK